MEQGVCERHTLGLSSSNRCECDSIPFLDRKESPRDVGSTWVVTSAQCPLPEKGPTEQKKLSAGE